MGKEPACHISPMSIEGLLTRDGILTYTIHGSSMEPMLRQGRDLVTVRARGEGERFREDDVVLYRRAADRKLTLHRIVRVLDSGYVLLGDNCARREPGIPDTDVLGVLVSFVRDGREHRVTDARYCAYVRRLRRFEGMRIALKLAKRRVRGWAKSVVICLGGGRK